MLIFVVVHAAPPQLASNLEYIQRFRMQSRMASESAYFFTQLVPWPCSLVHTVRCEQQGLPYAGWPHVCMVACTRLVLAMRVTALRTACIHQLPRDLVGRGRVRPTTK